VRVTKEGHYETRIDRHLFSVDYADVNRRVKGRRWSPWEQIVVLKEKRRPIPMFCGTKERGFSIPRNAAVGFDFERGEPLKPYGNGEYPDIMLVFSSNAPMKFSPARTNGLEISTANSDEGFIKKTFDAQSAFKSIYECPEADYVRKMSFSFAYSYTKVDNQRFPAGEYLVFRTRARHDEHGNLVGSRYGKIYSLSFDDDPDTPGNGFISLSYRFNPNENDRNLEWDGEDLSSGRKYDIDKILAPL